MNLIPFAFIALAIADQDQAAMAIGVIAFAQIFDEFMERRDKKREAR